MSESDEESQGNQSKLKEKGKTTKTYPPGLLRPRMIEAYDSRYDGKIQNEDLSDTEKSMRNRISKGEEWANSDGRHQETGGGIAYAGGLLAIIAGLISIVGGFVFIQYYHPSPLVDWEYLLWVIMPIITGIIAALATIIGIEKRNYRLAFIGGACAIVGYGFMLGIPGLILIALGDGYLKRKLETEQSDS